MVEITTDWPKSRRIGENHDRTRTGLAEIATVSATLPKMKYFFGHPQLFDCSGWWVVSLVIFKAGRDFGQLWNITLLLWNTIIRSKFNIFLYMYLVATLSWAASSGHFSKSASPLQGNIAYATPPLNLVRSLVLSLSGSFFGSQPRLQIHCIGPANTLHRSCKYI